MKQDKSRRNFIRESLITTGIISSGIYPLIAQDRPESLKLKLVKEFVSAGHNNLDRVKEMLENQPNLIYGTWDWGGGDFETAMGGAGHVGNKEIAEYLISKGCRVNLFVMTMLGKEDLVKPFLEEYPELIFAKGPHGFSLLHHARVGKSEVMEDYLLKKGLKEMKFSL